MTLVRTQLSPGVWLDARLGVFIEATGTLVVADLHWGYAASHRATGNLLPVWGDAEIERRLLSLISDYAPRELLWLGDSLHTLAGRAGAEQFIARSPVPVVLIAGNHDRRWRTATQRVVFRPGYAFHHGDSAPPVPPDVIEVVGHHHPAFAWSDGAGARVKVPALVQRPQRWILPAFSPWAAGVAWNDTLGADETLWAIAPRRIFAVPPSALRRRAASA